MDAILTQVKHLASTADEVSRAKLLLALRDAQFTLETPWDTMMRLVGLHLQIALIRVTVNLNIFATLESSAALSVSELAAKSGASPELLGRILRYLSSNGLIQQVSADSFTANSTTKILADLNWQAGIRHFFDTVGPVFQALPEFLQENKHQSIIDNTHTPFQKAWDTTLPSFGWLQAHPGRFKDMMAMFSIRKAADWLQSFPLQKELGSWTSATGGREEEKVLFVDMGGSSGRQAVGFRKKCESLGVEGRVVLQDLKETVERVGNIESVEVMEQDFFLPQSIKGAKFYYFRAIFHDYPDEKCLVILKNLIAVMDKASKILIDEVVLPDQGVHWQAAQMDLVMMVNLGAKERSRREWNALIEMAGLEILEVYTYTPTLQNSVLVIGLK